MLTLLQSVFIAILIEFYSNKFEGWKQLQVIVKGTAIGKMKKKHLFA